ncbi:DUF3883 domain-containing protein [Mesorhizobium sp. WSM3873]|uniref:DUF3883 domain-containing protein n=1 Tax=Mesorhizobium sp. WSM3873 TaxID=1854056 RepID=UPI000833D4C2|nr:DUF3883 domain-containing protein [Mesorhizobium sp. WSM3873]
MGKLRPSVLTVSPIEADHLPWQPPDFANHRQTRIGASVVEEFVSGHNASDVLRELVQNEFDGGGDHLIVSFGESALEVAGNGKGVSADGWKRLSVIVGTGRVVGAGEAERVDAKANGIGSKNFGLRSLFLFGDEIYVRSGGSVAVLDLKTLETGKVRDPGYWDGKGVRIQVPFRQKSFEMLEPFTAKHERTAFDVMARGMLATLVKLALPGKRAGLRGLTLRSTRCQRTLHWRQTAESLRSPMKGVAVVRRVGKLTDIFGTKPNVEEFEELEFTTSLEVPDEYSSLHHPSYFKGAGGRITIGVSLPLKRKKLDFTRSGYFHYPLQAPDAATGCLVSVSAPFILDNDRSGLTDHGWNKWLIEQAACLTVDLIVGDWFQRFGAGSFRAIAQTQAGKPNDFIDRVSELLTERECWPTRASGKLAKVDLIVVPQDPLLDGFLSDERYLHPLLAKDPVVRDLALSRGADRFTLAALVRLRCAGSDTKHLQTKLKKEEGNWHFASYDTALNNVDRQVKMAASLSALSRRLSPANRADLQNTASTLSAANTLRPAKDLVLVAPEIWNVSPEPMEHRLHQALGPHRAISAACRPFDEQNWIVEASGRASAGTISETERAALYARLLDDKAEIGRRALVAVRKAPTLRSQRGDWIAAERMVRLKGSLAKLMAPVLHLPSKELLDATVLMSKLKIRDRLASEDLIAFAENMVNRPSAAEAFERVLNDNLRLITPVTRNKLLSVPFLRSRAESLEAPKDLHLDTPLNRAVTDSGAVIVGGSNYELYRRIGIAEHPSVEFLLAILEGNKARSERPSRMDLIYPAIVEALKREKRSRHEFKDRPIIWWNGTFHPPKSILAGQRIPRVMDQYLPVIRKLDQTTLACLALGAREQVDESDWRKFFKALCDDWDRQSVTAQIARSLTEAYYVLGPAGLPSGLDDFECLLARNGYLFSLDELRAGGLMENDFPALADALDASDVNIGIVDVNERNRAFFHQLRIRPLSSLAGAGTPIFGSESRQPIWFKQFHDEGVIEMLRRPIFAGALHAIAVRRLHMFDNYAPPSLEELEVNLRRVKGVTFYESIVREYRVGSAVARVPVEAAVNSELIGLVSPRTRLDFQQLFAQALAELAGATNVDLIRTLSTDMLPLVLARSVDEIIGWLERVGVFIRTLGLTDGSEIEPPEAVDGVGEDAIRQVFESLDIEPEHDNPPVASAMGDPTLIIPLATQRPLKLPPLPPLDEVHLLVEEASEEMAEPLQGRYYGGHGYGGWAPRTGADIDRDQEVGQRGEALIYRMEIERVRRQGHPDPEKVVIWTSLADPGADHDICSIDAAGNPRWIEVKSTVGTDGRFDWSRKEFEKAIRERERYEIWRVYRAAEPEPVAKCFSNPSAMLSTSRLQLELATLQVTVEGLRSDLSCQLMSPADETSQAQ